MKIALSNGWNLEVDVEHHRKTPQLTSEVNPTATANELCGTKYSVVTTCIVSLLSATGKLVNPGVLGQGSAKCKVNDSFSRRKGAAIAVAAALRNSCLGTKSIESLRKSQGDTVTNRTLRTELWNKFWNGKYKSSIEVKRANRLARKQKKAKLVPEKGQ